MDWLKAEVGWMTSVHTSSVLRARLSKLGSLQLTNGSIVRVDYVAMQTLTRELSGYRITRRYDTGNKNDFVLVLTNRSGAGKLAAWTMGKPHTVRLDFKVKTPATV